MTASNAGPSNNAARGAILSRIRQGLGRAEGAAPGAAPPEPCTPYLIRARIDADGVLEQFKVKAAANLFQLHVLSGVDQVPKAVAKIARDHNIGTDVCIAPALAGPGWPTTLSVHTGKARVDEKLSVVCAVAGIAETGTLVLCSGAEAPSSLTFAGETSIVVVRAGDIVPYLEDGLARLKGRADPWPRAVNLVSGPSRTADIAGIVVRPAHGPKAVHVLLIGA